MQVKIRWFATAPRKDCGGELTMMQSQVNLNFFAELCTSLWYLHLASAYSRTILATSAEGPRSSQRIIRQVHHGNNPNEGCLLRLLTQHLELMID